MDQQGLSREDWLEKLILIDKSLHRQGATARLTLVGSATGILAGQPGRTSVDLDVWKPTSAYQFEALRTAVLEAGLLFDPKSSLEPDKPYLQLLDPGLAQTGNFEKTEILEQFQALRIDRPPIANLVAAKLIRADAKDLEDIAFLLSTYRPDRAEIARAVSSMPSEAREGAHENLVYLDTLGGNEKDDR